ncbi:MAG TPA: TMEM165/GDT1 family protein [Casimicrobiaceae bacterium]|nr:TMEM165/GDT1 family protein [Casimicrobiaceae bacterium]
MLTAFFVSVAAIAIGEIGDKTQLLALMLAARYRQPWPIVAGIFCATLANHALAGIFGNWVRHAINPEILRYAIAIAFFIVAVWALRPDKLEGEPQRASRSSVFAVTTLAFFLAEMGDKTQIATAVLAARYDALIAVIAGTTLGMLVADAPVVFAGKMAADRIPFAALRKVAAGIFFVMGVWVLLQGV